MSRKPPRGWPEIVVLALILILGIGGLAAGLFAAFVPPQRLLRAVAKGAEGGASSVDRSEMLGYLRRMRILGTAYVLAAIGLFLTRRFAARSIAEVSRSARVDLASLRVSAAHSRGELWWVIGLTLLAAAVRLPHLNGPMRFDEAVSSIYYVRRGVVYVLAAYGTTNHMLQNVLAWVGMKLFGFTPASVRLSCLFAGCALVPLSYAAARSIWDRTTALLAATAVATWPYGVFLSVNARGYTLVLCCFTACLALVGHLRRTNSAAGWAAFAVIGALGLWSIPIMVYPLLALAAWMIAVAIRTDVPDVPPLQFLGRGMVAGVFHISLFVLFYTPGMIKSGLTAVVQNDMTTPLAISQWLGGLSGYVADVWAHVAVPLPGWTGPILGALVLVEVFDLGGTSRRSIRPSPVPAAALAIGAVLLVQRLLPFPRVLSFLFLLAILSGSAGMTRLVGLAVGSATAARRVVWGLATFLAAGLIIATVHGRVHDLEETGVCRDARQIAAFLRTRPPDDQFLLGFLSKSTVDYYFLLDGPPRCRRYNPSNPPGVVWLVVSESQPIEDLFDIESIPRSLIAQFRQYSVFPHGGRVLRYMGPSFPARDQKVDIPGL